MVRISDFYVGARCQFTNPQLQKSHGDWTVTAVNATSVEGKPDKSHQQVCWRPDFSKDTQSIILIDEPVVEEDWS